ncbi:tRNA (adenosine(37)-N6)-threonylcarbamoyltransferase complex transferase subunit TsaD [Adhaeribacter rhizoryzae]|uniref:tRNA N6-adenosine threonylcarbamoyltransferase n=1 Tax=Adhaeribacter rhizoryzae TaxID=2607907 RepID=A0A5M6DB06_9BACT|nr:tRNA (adenosine(37)-N6)-threonylcarbamoyltransferase complex transferase subunit TsaD [Adhaeribacter rhizoryzae]KAA5544727.1 tRNA (adenosine(37)-N6)-threonylcarbamoyltransferase complex transferase subunit TsaD [Adhaeribacter rhizoryzae]
MSPTILAIESSCDDTSAAVIKDGKILANIVATQAVHEKYGGVVPELASRAHEQNIIPVVSQALLTANITKSELNAVAFTRGPGLLGALLVGCSFAKSFALGLNIPVIEVNHMQAHILAHFIDEPKPNFPFLCLTVSGGHTQIVLVKNYLEMQVLGQTTDDAVGEAFDKSAKLLGLPYPGGPMLDRLAQTGNPNAYTFPIVNMPNYDFSFSGIKTSILNFIKNNTQANPNFIQEHLPDICASIQQALIQTLMKKLVSAAKETNIKEIAIAGGVSANSGLRQTVQDYAKKYQWQTYIPAFQYCTDNAAMIAMTAHFKYLAGEFTNQYASPDPRLKISL